MVSQWVFVYGHCQQVTAAVRLVGCEALCVYGRPVDRQHQETCGCLRFAKAVQQDTHIAVVSMPGFGICRAKSAQHMLLNPLLPLHLATATPLPPQPPAAGTKVVNPSAARLSAACPSPPSNAATNPQSTHWATAYMFLLDSPQTPLQPHTRT